MAAVMTIRRGPKRWGAMAPLTAALIYVIAGCGTHGPVTVAYDDTDEPYLVLDAWSVRQVGSSGLQLHFSVAMSDGGDPPLLYANDIRIVDDQIGDDFLDGTEGRSRSGPEFPAGFQLSTVLVLDFSDSIFQAGIQDKIMSGVEKYLEALLVKSEDDDDRLARSQRKPCDSDSAAWPC